MKVPPTLNASASSLTSPSTITVISVATGTAAPGGNPAGSVPSRATSNTATAQTALW